MLNAWQKRNLTLYGKINIVKTLRLSKLVYSASVLTVPVNYTQQINKLIFNFIWAGNSPKIKSTKEKRRISKSWKKRSKLLGSTEFKTTHMIPGK